MPEQHKILTTHPRQCALPVRAPSVCLPVWCSPPARGCNQLPLRVPPLHARGAGLVCSAHASKAGLAVCQQRATSVTRSALKYTCYASFMYLSATNCSDSFISVHMHVHLNSRCSARRARRDLHRGVGGLRTPWADLVLRRSHVGAAK